MRRSWLRELIAVTLCSVVPATTLGCADNESMLFIQGVLRPEGVDCSFNAEPSAQMQLNGVLDVSFQSGYIAALLVGNQLTRQGDRDKVRTETARITLRGAVVQVVDPGTGDTITEYTTDGTGFADVGSGTEPGYGLMFAELVPPGVGEPGTRINVAVRVFGDTLGGDEIESNELIFPISVCSGCLISYPSEALDLQGRCNVPKPSTASDTEPVCNPGQDDPVECWDCAGANPACDAVPTGP
jgi:hypothetical protein